MISSGQPPTLHSCIFLLWPCAVGSNPVALSWYFDLCLPPACNCSSLPPLLHEELLGSGDHGSGCCLSCRVLVVVKARRTLLLYWLWCHRAARALRQHWDSRRVRGWLNRSAPSLWFLSLDPSSSLHLTVYWVSPHTVSTFASGTVGKWLRASDRSAVWPCTEAGADASRLPYGTNRVCNTVFLLALNKRNEDVCVWILLNKCHARPPN